MKKRGSRGSDTGADPSACAFQAIMALCAAAALGAWCVARTAPLWLSGAAVDPGWVHLPYGAKIEASPEPVERAAFVLMAAALPALALLAFRLTGLRWAQWGDARAPWRAWAWPSVAAAALLVPFTGAEPEFFTSVFFHGAWAQQHRLALGVVAAAVSVAVMLLAPRTRRASRRAVLAFVAVACVAGMVLQIVPVRLKTFGSVTVAPQWSVSFDAAIYGTTQVAAGKTLLVDLPSQYGMYPEIVAPVLRLFGGSMITAFAGLMAALQLAALTGIAYLLRRHVRSSALALLAFGGVFVTAGLVLYLDGITDEIYLQYFPLRLFWPVVVLVMFSVLARRSGWWPLLALGVAGGVASFWNLDTGVPAIAAVAATLFARTLIRRERAWAPVAVFIVASIATLGVCFGLVALKAGQPLPLQQAILYQRIFYGSGFAMMPMPVPLHPWESVRGLYSVCAVVALVAWARGARAARYDVLFCASVLGLGLFTYYQGRSHFYNLLWTMWPVYIVGALLADLVLRAVRARLVPRSTMLAVVPVVYFFALCSAGAVVAASSLADAAVAVVKDWGMVRDPLVASEGAFIRRTAAGRSCLIIAQRQGIYYAEARMANPVPGPGLVETLLQRDLDAMLAAATTRGVPCIYLGQGPQSAPWVDIDPAMLFRKYAIRAESSSSTMLLLEPR